MARIIAVRTHNNGDVIDGAVVVQDDDGTIAVYGEDKILRETIKKFTKTGITINETLYEGSTFMDGLLMKFNRKPYIWTVEMNEND